MVGGGTTKHLAPNGVRNVSSTWSLAKISPQVLQLCSQSRMVFHNKHPKDLGSHLYQLHDHRPVVCLGGMWAGLTKLMVYKATETLPRALQLPPR